MLERLVPSFVVTAETRSDLLDVELFGAEREVVARAVEKRRREFVTGRGLARDALGRLGVSAGAIGSGSHGEPLWPEGVVGSITHCAGFRACAVARSARALGIGIDAEPDLPLPAGVVEDVVHGPERALLRRDLGVDPGRLLFSAKEAVYKAWFPLTGRWLGFDDAEVSVDADARTFRAVLRVDSTPLRTFAGRWTVEHGTVCTAVVVPLQAAL